LEINLWLKQKVVSLVKLLILQGHLKKLDREMEQEPNMPLRLAMELGKNTEDRGINKKVIY